MTVHETLDNLNYFICPNAKFVIAYVLHTRP